MGHDVWNHKNDWLEMPGMTQEDRQAIIDQCNQVRDIIIARKDELRLSYYKLGQASGLHNLSIRNFAKCTPLTKLGQIMLLARLLEIDIIIKPRRIFSDIRAEDNIIQRGNLIIEEDMEDALKSMKDNLTPKGRPPKGSRKKK
jgi:hypothetical protein